MRYLTALIIALSVLSAQGKRQRTLMHGALRAELPTAAVDSTVTVPDTIVPEEGMIVFSGYDKTIAATRESFFVTNRTDSLTLAGLNFELEYTDIEGNQLHRAEFSLPCAIPPGQTRMLTVPSWDKQHSFYYYKSTAPTRRPGIPYMVKSKLLRIYIDTER